ncbi:uncharacterized protein LOC108665060 [Hyalella azteca]|uniref:Uncharacterized protein LOC108665060 n=1 Tax=Hyalella azteca TaxID=294128 RepID=A0A8B7N0A6_HYAAZ|nr:uncharacterized protein LOC108665060 [Hyalella azteca]
MRPKLVRLQELPLLVNGKVDRQKLLSDYSNVCQREVPAVDLSVVPEEDKDVAQDLMTVVGRLLGGTGGTTSHRLALTDNFFSVGGNSLNAVLVVTALVDLGYKIGLGDFLDCADFLAVVQKMAALKKGGPATPSCSASCSYTCHLLEPHMQDSVVELIADSFSSKSDMEVAAGIKKEDFYPLLHGIYPDILLQRLSFVVCDASGRIVACSLNFDLHAEPPVEVDVPLAWIFDMLEQCESKVRHKLPQNVGEVVHSFMMTTSPELGPKQNLELVKLMEEHNIKVARERKYKAVFTTNTSAATRYVCDDLLGYTVLSETPIADYTALDGQQPFASVHPENMAACTVFYV